MSQNTVAQSPNAEADAPVVKQIFMVLIGFAVVVAITAVVIGSVV